MNLLVKILSGGCEEMSDGMSVNGNNHPGLDAEMAKKLLVQFLNCRLIRDNKILREDLWIRDGKILDPEKLFFDEKIVADLQIDCDNLIISPGFIDLQLNGAFGRDFTFDADKTEENVKIVSSKLLRYGVTAFCPTIVSAEAEVYAKVLPKINKTLDEKNNSHAIILGLHLEGPFINKAKIGAHESTTLRTLDNGLDSLQTVYGHFDQWMSKTAILTLAPELDESGRVIKYLSEKNIVVSLGHSAADLSQGELAIKNGAKFITHLFNAMSPFHHRDPHLIGLLSNRHFKQQIYYGIIADGIHTHPAALHIAYNSHPDGLVLVTDAISAMGLNDGVVHHIGHKRVEIVADPNDKNIRSAFIEGTKTLCGSVATLNGCVRNLMEATGCSIVDAVKCASEHPAKLMNLYPRKGSLNYGADADFIVINESLDVKMTFIDGDVVWSSADWAPLFKYKLVPNLKTISSNKFTRKTIF